MMAAKRNAWLKPIGTGEEPLDDRWMPDNIALLTGVRFPEQPSGIKSGDLLVYYAAGKQRLFAVARSTLAGEECPMELAPGEERWPYLLPVQVIAAIPDLRFAPKYEVLKKASGAVQRKSHIRLSDAEYSSFLEAYPSRIQLHS